MKILVADNSRTNRFFLKDIVKYWFSSKLELDSFTVNEAKNSTEILEKLRDTGNGFDIAFISMFMRDMTAIDMLKKLDEEKIEKLPKIYICTSSLTEELEKEIKKSSAAGFIEKPFSVHEINDLLNQYLGSIIEEDDFLFDFDDLDEDESSDAFMEKSANDGLMDRFNQSHSQISAKAFFEENPILAFVGSHLDKLTPRMTELVNSLHPDKLFINLKELSDVLNDFKKVLGKDKSFFELSTSLEILDDNIKKMIKNESLWAMIAEKRKKQLASFFSAVLLDLISWKDHVFILKDAVDVFYINASSLSICMQIEKIIDDVIKNELLNNDKPIKVSFGPNDEGLFEILSDYDSFVICSETDLKGKITYVSKGFCKISGYSKAELLGQNHNMVRSPHTDSAVFENLWKKLKNGEDVVIDCLVNKHKNGELYYVYSYFKPVKYKNEIIGYRSLTRDITQEVRVKLLNDLFEANNLSLQHMNEKLKHNIEEKERELHLFKDDFVTLFTHELKTPLNAIINFSDYINKKVVDKTELTPQTIEKISNLSERIYNNGMSQKNMIDNLLDLAKLRSSQLEIHKTYFMTKEFFENILKRYVGIKGKKLTYDIEDFYYYADKKYCEMIFTNLLSNAIKYSKSKVKVSLKKIDDEFVLKIEDDGPGISFENKTKIFELFAQSKDQSTLKMERKGSGIGLYTVKMLVDICEKEIRVEDSEELGGSAFIIKGKMDND